MFNFHINSHLFYFIFLITETVCVVPTTSEDEITASEDENSEISITTVIEPQISEPFVSIIEKDCRSFIRPKRCVENSEENEVVVVSSPPVNHSRLFKFFN
jgi:hypothetical protein